MIEPNQAESTNPAVCIITMGCAKNEVDSAKMRTKILEAGYCICDEPNDAEVVIVNTCSFIQAATEESIDAIFEVTGLPRFEAQQIKLIVAGCMPARYGDDLAAEIDEASAFVPCSKEDDIVSIITMLVGEPHRGASTTFNASYMPTAGPYSAYVKISDGCDRFCSYCAIPFIRGRYHSFTFEQIEAEVSDAVSNGVREIILIAQDTGKWGTDFNEPSSLSWLMNELAERFENTWFRVMYLQPEEITDDLLDVIGRHDNIAHYLDIPLQHVNEKLLQAMNRVGSAEAFTALVKKIRARIPDVVLRTTVIAGFPGETDEMFDELFDFIDEGYFDYVGVFAYSQEEGTRSAKFGGQLPDEVKQERAQRLRDLADSICTSRLKRLEGMEFPLLIEGAEDDGQLFGRILTQAPEVDGITFVDKGSVGDVVTVEIFDSLFYDLEGENRCG